MITPIKIQEKQFQRSVRGYKEDEVDAFLDQIIISMDALMRENDALKAQCEQLKRNKPAEPVRSDSESVSETLAAAKNLMQQISDESEKHAEMIIRNAEEEARRIRLKAENDVQSLAAESERLQSEIRSFKQRYCQMLRAELARLDIEDETPKVREDALNASKSKAEMGLVELEKLSERDIFEDLENITASAEDDTMMKTPKHDEDKFEFSPDKELEELEMMNKATRVFKNGR